MVVGRAGSGKKRRTGCRVPSMRSAISAGVAGSAGIAGRECGVREASAKRVRRGATGAEAGRQRLVGLREAIPVRLAGRPPGQRTPRYGPRRAWSQRLSDRWLSRDGRPAISPSTLRSSSRSGQRMPCPAPISSQWSRSAGVAWRSRGYQARGTEMVRPSESSARSVSSVTSTSSASGMRTSIVEVIIPSVH